MLVRIIITLMLCSMVHAQRPTRGYVARSCGLDMNRNGIIGEAADCNVCDGVTTDPDGDGTDEDLNYVNSASGVNDVNCGAFGDECATVGYVLAGSNEDFIHVVNGPSDGAEDIVCIAGTFNEYLTGQQSGVAGFYTINATGSEVTNFQFPNNPFMIVGTDADNDGSYPPFDTDDTAIFDGLGVTGILIDQQTAGASYMEFAHFTADDYTTTSPSTVIGGIWRAAGVAASSSHIYFHDIEMIDIVRGLGSRNAGSARTFSMFGEDLDYFAVVNTRCTNCGAYWARGGNENADNWRFASNTLLDFDDFGFGTINIKIWDTITGIEVIDNIFDGQPDLYTPGQGGSAANKVMVVNVCTQDITFRNNEIIDHDTALNFQSFSVGACGSRNIDNVLIDGNIWNQNYEPFNNPTFIAIGSGTTLTTTTEDVTVVNNFVSCNVDSCSSAIIDVSGNDSGTQPGTLTIAGNTFEGPWFRAIDIDSDDTFIRNNFVINSNIFDTGTGLNIRVRNNPTNFVADGNVYDPDGTYHWDPSNLNTFAEWQAASGADANSTECVPVFVDITTADLHLGPTDTCATDAGVDIISITTVDIDGNDRLVLGSADAGADESGGTFLTLSGTLSDGATEAEIVAGGQTAIVTISGPPTDTWISALGGDNTCSTNFLGGFDSESSIQSEANGWNAIVSPALNFSHLDRTSPTAATVTLPAFASYDITENETVGITIPAECLTESTSALTTAPAAVVVQAAGGSTLSITLSGFITGVTDSTSHLPAAIGVNDAVTGAFTYDTAATDRSSSSEYGEYLFNQSPSSLSLTVNDGANFHTWETATNFKVEVVVRNGTTADQLELKGRGLNFPSGVTATTTSLNSSLLYVLLKDSSSSVFNNDSIPSSLVIGSFDESIIEIIATTNTATGASYKIVVEGIVTLNTP